MGRRFLFAILCGCTILGCSRKTMVHKYYLLETTDIAAKQAASGTPLVSAVCEIMPVKIHPAFSGTRIAVRMDSHQLAYYTRHEWAANPDEALLQLAEAGLQSRNLFRHVSGRVAKAIPEFRIQIQVRHLEAIQNQKQETLSAHLEVELTLIEAVTNRTLVSHTADQRTPLEENRLNLFAAAVSQLFDDELQSFADKMASHFQSVAEQDSSR